MAELGSVCRILKEIKPDVDFENETALFDDGLIDSFDIIAIVNELNESFGVEISIGDLEPENFNSAKAMCALVQSLGG